MIFIKRNIESGVCCDLINEDGVVCSTSVTRQGMERNYGMSTHCIKFRREHNPELYKSYVERIRAVGDEVDNKIFIEFDRFFMDNTENFMLNPKQFAKNVDEFVRKHYVNKERKETQDKIDEFNQGELF